MKLCRFACIVFSACAWARGAVVVPDSAVVGIYLQFDKPSSEVAVRGMEAEIARIMEPAGLRFEWRDLGSREKEEQFPDLLVLRFRGTCNSISGQGSVIRRAEPVSLARTAVADGDVLPFSEIECDRIRTYISPFIEGLGSGDVLYGRALGRVVAHEMYHILVETQSHGSQGVARGYHRAKELVAPSFTFDEPEARQLRTYAQRHSTMNALQRKAVSALTLKSGDSHPLLSPSPAEIVGSSR